MRRSTPHCTYVARDQQALLRALVGLDIPAITRELEELVLPERAARIRAVLAARLDSVTAIMDAPHDPHNGAAVIRSCDAFGVQRLHVVERYEGFLASTTVARGSERWVDVHSYPRTDTATAALAASGHELIATHPEGELEPADLARIPRVALVLGNERDGIHDELRAACKRSVRIPMRGFAESLNVSVTAAILLQHATAGRAGDLGQREKDFLLARALILTIPRAPEILQFKGVFIGALADAPTLPAA